MRARQVRASSTGGRAFARDPLDRPLAGIGLELPDVDDRDQSRALFENPDHGLDDVSSRTFFNPRTWSDCKLACCFFHR